MGFCVPRRSSARSYSRREFDPSSSSLTLADSAPGQYLVSTDRVRLDVMLSGDRELFSWAGEDRFRSEPLNEIIGGASTTGEFWPFVTSIFLAGGGEDGELQFLRFVNGPEGELAEFHFRVPRSRSHYMVQTGKARESATGYEGTFRIDADTAVLRHLTIELRDPPPESDVLRGRIETAFENRIIGDRRAMLPAASTLRLLSSAGNLAVNQTRYSGCKRFTSTSEIHLDDSPVEVSGAPAFQVLQPLPQGLLIYTRGISIIDSKTSSAGDPLEARISRPVLDREGKELVPAGALLRGRIVFLKTTFHPAKSVGLKIRFESIQVPGGLLPIHLAAVGTAESISSRRAEDTASSVTPLTASTTADIQVFGSSTLRIDSRVERIWRTR